MAALPEALSACSRIVHSKAPRFKKCLHNSIRLGAPAWESGVSNAWGECGRPWPNALGV